MANTVNTSSAHELKEEIVAEYQYGKSKVKINNLHFCKTKEERAQVDHDIAMVAWSIIDELIERGEEI